MGLLAICVAVLLLCGIVITAEAGAAKHWICRKCGKRVSKESRPSLSGCPEGGTHLWIEDY